MPGVIDVMNGARQEANVDCWDGDTVLSGMLVKGLSRVRPTGQISRCSLDETLRTTWRPKLRRSVWLLCVADQHRALI